MISQRNRDLALAAMLSTLSWFFLCLAGFAAPSALWFELGSVFSLYLAARVLGPRWGLAVFAGSSLLGMLFPGLLRLLPYLLFGGPYLLLGFLLYPRFQGKKALLLRILLGSLLLAGLAVLAQPLLGSLSTSLLNRLGPWKPALLAAAPLGVYLYDVLLSGMEGFYRRYLEKALRRR